MPTTLSSPPTQASLTEIDPKDPIFRRPHLLSKQWTIWLQEVVFTNVQQSTQVIYDLTVTAQTAAIPATPFSLGTVAAGIYRVSWYTRITTAATVSSSLTVSLHWTETSVSLTSSGAAITGNSSTTTQSGSVILRSDANAPITYETAYVSVGATPMAYRLEFTIERMS